ncbi:hypothetical protein CYMTET_17816, partial [Cymbomonas tetramitiformis]
WCAIDVLLEEYFAVRRLWKDVVSKTERLEYNEAIAVLESMEAHAATFLSLAKEISAAMHPVVCTQQKRLQLSALHIAGLAILAVSTALFLCLGVEVVVVSAEVGTSIVEKLAAVELRLKERLGAGTKLLPADVGSRRTVKVGREQPWQALSLKQTAKLDGAMGDLPDRVNWGGAYVAAAPTVQAMEKEEVQKRGDVNQLGRAQVKTASQLEWELELVMTVPHEVKRLASELDWKKISHVWDPWAGTGVISKVMQLEWPHLNVMNKDWNPQLWLLTFFRIHFDPANRTTSAEFRADNSVWVSTPVRASQREEFADKIDCAFSYGEELAKRHGFKANVGLTLDGPDAESDFAVLLANMSHVFGPLSRNEIMKLLDLEYEYERLRFHVEGIGDPDAHRFWVRLRAIILDETVEPAPQLAVVRTLADKHRKLHPGYTDSDLVQDLYSVGVMRTSAAASPHATSLYLVVLRDLAANHPFTYAALALRLSKTYRDEKPLPRLAVPASGGDLPAPGGGGRSRGGRIPGGSALAFGERRMEKPVGDRKPVKNVWYLQWEGKGVLCVTCFRLWAATDGHLATGGVCPFSCSTVRHSLLAGFLITPLPLILLLRRSLYDRRRPHLRLVSSSSRPRHMVTLRSKPLRCYEHSCSRTCSDVLRHERGRDRLHGPLAPSTLLATSAMRTTRTGRLSVKDLGFTSCLGLPATTLTLPPSI